MKISPYILAVLLINFPLWAQEAVPTLEKPPKLIELVPADIPAGTDFPASEIQVLLELEVDQRESLLTELVQRTLEAHGGIDTL